jgi:hypothetical protein
VEAGVAVAYEVAEAAVAAYAAAVAAGREAVMVVEVGDDGCAAAWAVTESAGAAKPRLCRPPESAWKNRVR